MHAHSADALARFPTMRVLTLPAASPPDGRRGSMLLGTRMPQAVPAPRTAVLVLLPFVTGYYLTCLYRSINALISENLKSELGLSPGELGFLTAAFFLAFAAVQLPLGVWLDRFGPRKVQGALLAVATCGGVLFAAAQGFPLLALGRALLGLGMAGALMAGLKAIILWLPQHRVASANSWFMMLGALGVVSATAPAEMVLAQLGWRGVFCVLAAATAAAAAAILVLVPERRHDDDQSSTASIGLKDIYCDRRFWRLAPLSATCVGSSWALQGLWAAPWLVEVEALDRSALVMHLFIMAVGLCASALLLGLGAERLRRRGITLAQSFAAIIAVALLAQLALVLRWSLPIWLPWVVIAGVGTVTALSYAMLNELYPRAASGRANGALNVLHVTTAFAVQYIIGLIVEIWPAEAGRHPAIAYQTALGVMLAVQVAALIWFIRPERRQTISRLAQHPVHAVAEGLMVAPAAAAVYLVAREALAARLIEAVAQRQAWRMAAFGSLVVLVLLTASFANTVPSKSTIADVRQQPSGPALASQVGLHAALASSRR